jgi:hypothetical protein
MSSRLANGCREHMICPLREQVECPRFGRSRLQAWSGEVTMLYAAAAVERAMKIQQVIVRALSGNHHVVAGGRHLGPRSAQHAALARPL